MSEAEETKKKLIRRLQEDVYARHWVTLIAYGFCAFLYWRGIVPALTPFTYLLFGMMSFNILTAYLLSKNIFHPIMIYGNAMVDSFVITVAVHFSGGFNSPLTVVYFVPVIIEAAHSYFPSMIFTINFIALCYFSMLYFGGINVFTPEYFPQVAGRIVLFVTISIVAALYAYQITKREESERKAKEELLKVDKLKDDFVSMATHELRTPLASIKAFAEILMNRPEATKEERQEFLQVINEESNRLTRIVNDVLDLTKIKAGKMQWSIRPMEIAKSIKAAVAEINPFAKNKKQEIKIEINGDLSKVNGDEDKIIQVLENLLANAVKFTGREGTITVGAKDENNMVEVRISDSGIGISEEDKGYVFEEFIQVTDATEGRPRGTGLGLPICKKIIEHLGGRIWVESELGKGSIFYFTLPKSREE